MSVSRSLGSQWRLLSISRAYWESLGPVGCQWGSLRGQWG